MYSAPAVPSRINDESNDIIVGVNDMSNTVELG